MEVGGHFFTHTGTPGPRSPPPPQDGTRLENLKNASTGLAMTFVRLLLLLFILFLRTGVVQSFINLPNGDSSRIQPTGLRKIVHDWLDVVTRPNVVALYGPIEDWNVSEVTNMQSLCYGFRSFDADLSKWNVESVIDMSSMFNKAPSFNSDISTWNTAKVTNMSKMFENAGAFNGDLSHWNTDAVADMTGSTFRCCAYNCYVASPVVKRYLTFVLSVVVSYCIFVSVPLQYLILVASMEFYAMANGPCITCSSPSLCTGITIVVVKDNTWQFQVFVHLTNKSIVEGVLLGRTPINTTLILVVKIVNLVCTHRSRRNRGAILGPPVLLGNMHSLHQTPRQTRAGVLTAKPEPTNMNMILSGFNVYHGQHVAKALMLWGVHG
jgi:surface protein